MDDASRVIAALRRRFPAIIGPPKEDICYATQNRQEAVQALAGEGDLVLVIGSRNSSNSIRLTEVARASGRPAYLIDEVTEIDPAWFDGAKTVVLTAGASAPGELVWACLEYLREGFGAEVEERTFRREEVQFPLPRELCLPPNPQPPRNVALHFLLRDPSASSPSWPRNAVPLRSCRSTWPISEAEKGFLKIQLEPRRRSSRSL